MTATITTQNLFKKYIAIPQDHGSWVFLLSPLLIGLFAGGDWGLSTFYLILAAFAAFLIRQPVIIATKIYSGRRGRRDLSAAWFWIGIYGLLAIIALAGLISQGFVYLLYLALPGIPVFAWHLYLVSQRAERRQMAVEMVGSGVLALAAPAGLWVGVGEPSSMGWWLFILVWLQSAASIVYAYLRLEQRALPELPPRKESFKLGWRALIYTSFNLLFVIGLSLSGILPLLIPLPYLLQWGETIWGIRHPAIGFKPTSIGIRQLIVSTIFTFLFIAAWGI